MTASRTTASFIFRHGAVAVDVFAYDVPLFVVECLLTSRAYSILYSVQSNLTPGRQGDEYHMTIAHHWNAEGRTIPMRYDTAIEDLIRRSSERESPGHLAHRTSNS